MIELSAVIVRQFGQAECETLLSATRVEKLASTTVNVDERAPIIAWEQQLKSNTPEGAALRAMYEHVLIIKRNTVTKNYQFAPAS